MYMQYIQCLCQSRLFCSMKFKTVLVMAIILASSDAAPLNSCHNLPYCHYHYFQHFVQRHTVNIRSLNWLTCCLLLRLQEPWVPLWWDLPLPPDVSEAAAVPLSCLGAPPQRTPGVVRLEENTLPVVDLGVLCDFFFCISFACLHPR
jgi:hypothetical protein